VVPLAPGQQVIRNESDSATLFFRIDEAAPPVLLQDLRWFYVAGFGDNPFAGQDITNLTNRTAVSMLTFSDFVDMRYIDLTVSNITQRRGGIGGETDEGRYFLVATNPAGVRFSYIDLLVFGMYVVCDYVLFVYICKCVCGVCQFYHSIHEQVVILLEVFSKNVLFSNCALTVQCQSVV